MAVLKIAGSTVEIAGLGSVSVSTKEVGAIRVSFTKQAALESVSHAYHAHARGVRLVPDGDGELDVDGMTAGRFSLSSRGSKPAVFELRHSQRGRRPTMFSGVLTERRP